MESGEFRDDIYVRTLLFAPDITTAKIAVLHLVGVAHEIALAVSQGDESRAIEMLSAAVNIGKELALENHRKIMPARKAARA